MIARRALTAFLVAGIACTSSSHLAAPSTNPPVHQAVVAPSASAPSNCAWRSVPLPPVAAPRFSASLRGISFGSANSGWAIGIAEAQGPTEGGTSHSFLLRWNGRRWRLAHTSIPRSADLSGVWASSPNNAWAVGGIGHGGFAARWDGQRWAVERPQDPGTEFWGFSAVSGSGPADVWAVGATSTGHSGGTLAEHWNGRAWRIVPVPNPPPRPQVGSPFGDLDAVDVRSPTEAWAAGQATNVGSRPAGLQTAYIYHWDGSRWGVLSTPNASVGARHPFDGLSGIAAPEPNDAWAVGSYSGPAGAGGRGGRGLLEHFDGSTWTVVPEPWLRSSVLEGVVSIGADSVWVAGTRVTRPLRAFIARWDGRRWILGPSLIGSLNAIGIDPAGRVWAAGSNGTRVKSSPLLLACSH